MSQTPYSHSSFINFALSKDIVAMIFIFAELEIKHYFPRLHQY
jgi:hypothetical protein